MDKSNKRKRSSNWIEEDKTLLRELIKERVAMIEDKNTDTNTNQRKKRAWFEIEKRFNNRCRGGTRNVIQLKSQWTLMKIQAKKEVISHRKQINKTDGEQQPLDIKLSANHLSAWLPQEFIIDDTDLNDVASEISRPMEDSNEEIRLPENDVEVKLETESAPEFEEEKEQFTEALQQTAYKKKKKTPPTCQSLANIKIRKLADLEVKYREEIHLLQKENERKKARNLDLEFELLQEKIKFFKKKVDVTCITIKN